LTIFVDTTPRWDIDTFRDRLEIKTLRQRPKPWIQNHYAGTLSIPG